MLTLILAHADAIRFALMGLGAALFLACLYVTHVPEHPKDRGGFYP